MAHYAVIATYGGGIMMNPRDAEQRGKQLLEHILEDKLTTDVTQPCGACDATVKRNRFGRWIITHQSGCGHE